MGIYNFSNKIILISYGYNYSLNSKVKECNEIYVKF